MSIKTEPKYVQALQETRLVMRVNASRQKRGGGVTETRTAVLYRCGRPLKIEKLHIPTLKRGQVLVKIYAAGLCRSQANEIQGRRGPDRYLPHTLGHEGSGVVEAVGLGVKKIRVKDPVVISWIKSRGLEGGPAAYQNSRGETVHSGPVSTFMEYAVISENRLVKIPEGMPLREAVLLGCAMLTGGGIVFNTLKLKPHQGVAVFGTGGVGLSVVTAAKLVKADPIIAVDVREENLEKAISMGASHRINACKEDVVEAILKITDGLGVDFAVESAGTRQAMESAFRTVKEKNGLCVIAGNLSRGEVISIDPFELIKGKRIIGTWGGNSLPERDIPSYVEFFKKGELDLEGLIVAEYPLERINEAFEGLDGQSGRTLVRMGTGTTSWE